MRSFDALILLLHSSCTVTACIKPEPWKEFMRAYENKECVHKRVLTHLVRPPPKCRLCDMVTALIYTIGKNTHIALSNETHVSRQQQTTIFGMKHFVRSSVHVSDQPCHAPSPTQTMTWPKRQQERESAMLPITPRTRAAQSATVSQRSIPMRRMFLAKFYTRE